MQILSTALIAKEDNMPIKDGTRTVYAIINVDYIERLEKQLKEYEEFFKELKHIAKSKNFTGLEKGWVIEEMFDEWEKNHAEQG